MKREQLETEKAPSRSLIKVLDERKPTSKQQSSGNITWAIDPNEQDIKQLQKMAEIINIWIPNEKNILPISILSPMDLGWPMEISRRFRRELLERARTISRKKFARLPFRRDAAEILISPGLSLLSSVRKMIQFATRHKSELIVLYSRQGEEKRLIGFGSFSELTVASSNIPVMVVGKQTKVPQKISKILYPTDFSTFRKKSFQMAIEWAQRFDAELILFHQLGSPLTPIALMSLDAPMNAALLEAAWEEQRQNEKEKGEQWVREAMDKGVKCRIAIEMSSASWTKRILDAVQKEKVDLLVVSHRRGLWGQTLLGGRIRKLFAETTCPLILTHIS